MSLRFSFSSTKYGPSVLAGDRRQASPCPFAARAAYSPASARPRSLPSRPATYTAPAVPTRPSSFLRLKILFLEHHVLLSRRRRPSVGHAPENALRGS
jgi:hypothetical protein